MLTSNAPKADNVLTTLDANGKRIWMRPKPSIGKYYGLRKWTAYALIATFFLLPFISIGEYPAILLNIGARRFHLFGLTFHPTDSALLMLLLLSIFISIFWFTALFGRVWCGWGCPQTVYMEFIFRPLERLLEGPVGRQRLLDKKNGFIPAWPRIKKYAVYLFISFLLGNQFLSYFVGWERLATWITASPFDHPEGFIIMAVTSCLVFFNFSYFREQMCTVICPYARLQSALLDKNSLIVGYDRNRGESRRQIKQRTSGDNSGDCIDCGACVSTCPTGIDIRNGLQLECIACTQCADACDHIMAKTGKPSGLIRLCSQHELETGKPANYLRIRTLIYPLLILGLATVLIFSVQNKPYTEATILRQLNAPYIKLGDSMIRNQLRVKITNRSSTDHTYTLDVVEPKLAQTLAPQFPLQLRAGDSLTTPVFIALHQSLFNRGKRDIMFELVDELGQKQSLPYLLLAPEE